MRLLAIHPGPLMYTKVFLRLEPLGLELVAAAALQDGHEVRMIDLQVEQHRDLFRLLAEFQPEVVAFSCNYLANVPEIISISKAISHRAPGTYIVVGGHSASFIADALLDHGGGAIDCVLKGEGEAALPRLLAVLQDGARDAASVRDGVPGAVTAAGRGRAPVFVESLDALRPARHLLRHRRRYFIGPLDPAASIEFSRGCPWDCAFCSAWTFYGRSYRMISPERAVEDLAAIREPGVFIVDDVAFVHPEHGHAIADAVTRRNIRKRYYLETRGDVLLRNRDVFSRWKSLGLEFMFLGLEAIDEEGLRKYRKRASLGRNFEALEFARSLGIHVAINLIVDPDWDEARFAAVREWCLDVPEVVNLSINTPYPGTETWLTEQRHLTTRDYRLFDIQHCVLPTRLPLGEFYGQLVRTQQVLNKKHLGWSALRQAAGLLAGQLARGQTNFARSLFRFNSVYDAKKLLADHAMPVTYHLPQPATQAVRPERDALYVHRRAATSELVNAGPPSQFQ